MKLAKVEVKRTESLKRHTIAIAEAFIQALKPLRITIEYPRERRKYPDTFRGFIVFNPERCISCFRCAQICPANAIQMSSYKRAYPGIDYSKCIFCHFCVDSCPTGALSSSKVHDVAFKNMDEMFVKANQMTSLPEIYREDEITVEYEIEKGVLKLKREKIREDLSLPAILPAVKAKKVVCIDPESCIGCKLCIQVCPHEAREALVFERDENKIKIVIDKCLGCGLCVRVCPMNVLRLEVVK